MMRVTLDKTEIVDAEDGYFEIRQDQVIIFEGEDSVANIEFQRVSNLLKG